jgi:hypothetical protein
MVVKIPKNLEVKSLLPAYVLVFPCSLPLFVLFVGAPSTSRESIGLRRPTEAVDCLGSAWPLKLATKETTGPKLL